MCYEVSGGSYRTIMFQFIHKSVVVKYIKALKALLLHLYEIYSS